MQGARYAHILADKQLTPGWEGGGGLRLRAPALGPTAGSKAPPRPLKRANTGQLALSSEFDHDVLRAAATLQATPTIYGSMLDPMTALYDSMGDGDAAAVPKKQPKGNRSVRVQPEPN